MKTNQKNTTRNIVMSALLAALVCVATMLIKVPSPLKGYLNLGDGIGCFRLYTVFWLPVLAPVWRICLPDMRCMCLPHL